MKKLFYFISITCIILAIVGLVSYTRLSASKQKILLKSISYTYNRYVLHKPFLIAKSNYGVNFKFKTDDAIGEEIYKHSNYETLLTKFVVNNVNYKVNDIVLDVGANLGWYSLIIDKKINAKIDIYAFEPDELNYQLLADNVKLNNACKVTTIKKAISNESGHKTLYQSTGKNLGEHSLLPISNAKTTTVEAITLDEFVMLNNIDPKRIKLLKVDVEGYEGQVFLKANNILNHVQYVLHGFTQNTTPGQVITPQALIQLLASKGLSPFLVTESGLKPLTTEQILKEQIGTNLLWMRI